MPRFRLLDEDGVDLGPFLVNAPVWRAGDRIQRGPGDALEVVRVVEAEEVDDVDGYLVVRKV